VTLAVWARSAATFSSIRRALRASVLGSHLGKSELDSLKFAVQLLEQALRATKAASPLDRASAAFSGDAKALRLLRETLPDPVYLERANLERLRNLLQAVHDRGDVQPSEVEDAIKLFSRLNNKSLDAARSIQTSRSTRSRTEPTS
jgi:hypothetical protein